MHSSNSSRRAAWVALGLAALTFAVFSGALRCQFLTFDDQAYVTENRHVQEGLTASNVGWAFRSVIAGNWHPLTLLSHMLDCQIYGLRPWGHHLTNVLLHCANVVLLFIVLYRMTGGLWRSACVAALFAVHPTRVESVAWIAERKDLLCGFFVLATCWAYVNYTAAKSIQRGAFYGLVIALFACALMSKPMAVTLPFALLLLDYWPLRRLDKKSWPRLALEKLPLMALCAAGCAVTILTQQRSHAMPSIRSLTLVARIEHAFVAYLNYLRVMFFPWRLAVFYPYRLHESALLVIGASVMIAALTIASVALARKYPYVFVGWLWFVGVLFPVIGIAQAGAQGWADRYTYLPSIGLFVVVVWGGAELAQRAPALRFLAPAGILLCMTATVLELRYWKDTRTLFTRALEVTENNYLAMTLVGSMKADAGDLDGAIVLYHDALRHNTEYPEAHLFLGRALERKGQLDLAVHEYGRAAELKPELAEADVLEGLVLAREKEFSRAVQCYQAALRADPESASAENDWGRVLQTEGQIEESISHYRRALALDPSLAEAHNNLAVEYLQSGQLTAGIEQLRDALRGNPTNKQTQYNLAQALNQSEQWNEAATLLKPLAAADPNDPKTQYQYGLALEHQGHTREAMGCFAAAILRDGSFADALNELAWIAATSRQPELRNGAQAAALARRSVELTARQRPEMLVTLAAASAECGQFKEAIEILNEAENLARVRGEEKILKKAQQVRGSLSSGQPFRQ